MTSLQKAEAIRKLDLFSEVSVEDLYRLAAIAREVEFAAGQTIYKTGDIGDAFYVIVTGQVESGEEENTTRVVVREGVAVGLSSVLIREARQTSAKALDDTFALAIGAEDFYNLLSSNSEITVSLIKHFVRKVGISL